MPCEDADLDNLYPKCPYTYLVNPEQSKPVFGDAEPCTYLYPKYFFANLTNSFLFSVNFSSFDNVFLSSSTFVLLSSCFFSTVISLAFSSFTSLFTLDLDVVFFSPKVTRDFKTYPVILSEVFILYHSFSSSNTVILSFFAIPPIVL